LVKQERISDSLVQILKTSSAAGFSDPGDETCYYVIHVIRQQINDKKAMLPSGVDYWKQHKADFPHKSHGIILVTTFEEESKRLRQSYKNCI